MAAERFFHRWARLKNEDNANGAIEREAPEDKSSASLSDTHRASDASAKQSPTLEEVSKLTASSDYSVFVAKGVDKTVQRLAMKKLFSDPHFNTMDGLDIYIDDYTQPSPLSRTVLASLKHAKDFLVSSDEVDTEHRDESKPGENEGHHQPDLNPDLEPQSLETPTDIPEASIDECNWQKTKCHPSEDAEWKTV
jgi:hypothetical protein